MGIKKHDWVVFYDLENANHKMRGIVSGMVAREGWMTCYAQHANISRPILTIQYFQMYCPFHHEHQLDRECGRHALNCLLGVPILGPKDVEVVASVVRVEQPLYNDCLDMGINFCPHALCSVFHTCLHISLSFCLPSRIPSWIWCGCHAKSAILGTWWLQHTTSPTFKGWCCRAQSSVGEWMFVWCFAYTNPKVTLTTPTMPSLISRSLTHKITLFDPRPQLHWICFKRDHATNTWWNLDCSNDGPMPMTMPTFLASVGDPGAWVFTTPSRLNVAHLLTQLAVLYDKVSMPPKDCKYLAQF